MGAGAARVRLALCKKFGLSPQQVEQLMLNQAGPLTGLMEHQAAWTLRNELQELGLDCRIAPVPRSNVKGFVDTMSLQGTDPDRRVGLAIPARRAQRQIQPMRTGKPIARVRSQPARPVFSIPPMVRIGTVLAVILLVGFSLQANREPHADATVAAADSVH